MNILELQQRANLLVQKVNDYEASLSNVEWDEQDIINQHRYTDLYSLRPVLKLLFGNSISEKTNRTLDNDLALRVFASSAPMWNSSFNLLSYSIDFEEDYFKPSTDAIIDENNNLTSGTTTTKVQNLFINDFSKQSPILIKLKFTVTARSLSDSTPLYYIYFDSTNKSKYFTIDLYKTSTYISIYVTAKPNTNIPGTMTGYLVQSIPAYQPSMIPGTYELEASFGYTSKGNPQITAISFKKDGIDIGKLGSVTSSNAAGAFTYSQWNVQARIPNSYFTIDLNTPFASGSPVSFDVDYKSDQHEFMNDIHNYNQNNLITLDAKQNLITDRDTRIKQGINYGYAANIQDALVTESQIANIFKWNTTTDESVQNNVITINRQVPGVVCYYLGNDYTGDYTATIPYNPGISKLNQINYSTPPSYGAFYTTDQSTSQVPVWTGVLEENKGHEACRIFIPSMHYTRGKLESPQQIWQPDMKFGSSNDNLGYNWQGQALYHELVFKNRRSGTGDLNIDFIPAVDSVPDNDPQGLATRYALAKQKDFYKNRSWFNELDEFYETQPSRLVKIIENNSYIINEGGTFDKDKFSIGSDSEVSDEGILTSTSLNADVSANLENEYSSSTMTFISPKYILNLKTSGNDKYQIYNSEYKSEDNIHNLGFRVQYRPGLTSILFTTLIGTSIYNNDADLASYIIKGFSTLTLQFKIIFTLNDSGTTTCKYYTSYNNAEYELEKEYTGDSGIPDLPKLNFIKIGTDITQSADLTTIKVIGDNDEELFTALTDSSKTYMTDEQFYNQFKLDYNMFASAFNLPK